MLRLLHFVLALLGSTVRTRLSLHLEVAALHHQLCLYKRTRRRPRFTPADRLLWSILARLWADWRKALHAVQPRTVIAWQQKRFRNYWRELSRRGSPGRPRIAPELMRLIERMWQANPTWGSPRIVGELAKLGITVAKSTVEKYRPRSNKAPSPTWRTFLDQHLHEIAAVDFFIVPTITMKVLFVFVVIAHDRRRIVHFNVTEHPTARWTAQQFVEAFPFDTAPRYLLRDGDAIYSAAVERRTTSLGIDDTVTAPASPWQNKQSEYFQALFKRTLGLEIKIDKQIFKQPIAKMLAGEFDLVLAGWGPDYDDPLTFADLFASWNLNNRGRYDNPLLDAQVRVAQRSTDAEERVDAFAEIQRIVIDDVVIIPIYERGATFVTDPRLKVCVPKIHAARGR